ncbi:MAG: hypothetical protein K0R61_1043 [Microvirga sp.]|jgi:hypothetical protein|nr:hypothetical protein [Microvirga sp.]MDF2970593.1 hypothetical protein [Microvirga sp.]
MRKLEAQTAMADRSSGQLRQSTKAMPQTRVTEPALQKARRREER